MNKRVMGHDTVEGRHPGSARKSPRSAVSVTVVLRFDAHAVSTVSVLLPTLTS